jgi:Holliday junction resolvase RusA-like endonuclease
LARKDKENNGQKKSVASKRVLLNPKVVDNIKKPVKRKTKSAEVSFWSSDSDNVHVTRRSDPHISVDDPSFDSKNFVDIAARGMFSLIHFTVRGNPLPLRRHRTRQGFIYNPSAAAQESFRSVVRRQLKNLYRLTNNTSESDLLSQSIEQIQRNSLDEILITDDDDNKPTISSKASSTFSPVFSPNQQLAMTIIFNMRRPKNHFVASKSGPGRLRATYNSTMSQNDGNKLAICPTTTSDVDNLAKFVLDSLNEILYEDDRQVVSLHAIKMYDSSCPNVDCCCQGSTLICIKAIDTLDDLNNIIATSLVSVTGNDHSLN